MLNGHPGPCPDKELFCPVLESIQMFPLNLKQGTTHPPLAQ